MSQTTDDPYAGADLTSSRNATAVLVALHGALVLILLPLFPPTEGAGAAIGWALALAFVAVNLASAAWLFRMPEVRFGFMLAVAYTGIAELVTLQLFAQTVLPYQALFLIWVGAGAVRVPRLQAATANAKRMRDRIDLVIPSEAPKARGSPPRQAGR